MQEAGGPSLRMVLLFAMAGSFALMILGFAIVWRRRTLKKFAYKNQNAKNAPPIGITMCIVQTVLLCAANLTYTLIIPRSYMISKLIGQSAIFSGVLIGIDQTGALLGAASMWLLFRIQPNIWQSRTVILAAVACNFAGATSFLLAMMKVGRLQNQADVDLVPWLLCIARFVDGIGMGTILQFGQMSLVHLFPSSDRPGWMATNQFFAMLGIGIGPMVASTFDAVYEYAVDESKANTVGFAYIGIAAGAFLTVWLLYPYSTEVRAAFQPSAVEEELLDSSEDETIAVSCGHRLILIFGALTMTATRALVVSSLEAATSLLLEKNYQWKSEAIGVAIGASFLTCIPLKFMYNMLKDSMGYTTWLSMLALVAIGGSALLFCTRGVLVLIADGILFPTIFLGDALTAGLMMMSQHLFATGSFFDANHVILYREILKAVGRSVGPPLARMTVDGGGQKQYAIQQVVLAVLFLFLLELLVKPNVRIAKEEWTRQASPAYTWRTYAARFRKMISG